MVGCTVPCDVCMCVVGACGCVSCVCMCRGYAWWLCDVLCGWGCMRGEQLGEEAEEWCGLECGDMGLDCCGEEIKK